MVRLPSPRAAVARAAPAFCRTPYRVWLSEIMLQQTTVKAVGPYFGKFIARWPDVTALGSATLDDVLRMWAGLGYYSRARNLHACAVTVLREHGGRFPDTEEGLRALSGIGPYTAAAIAAIAFGRRTMPVDGNIERVVSRLFAVEEFLPKAKPRIQSLASTLLGPSRAGDSAQALMDLGATICTPTRPACALCPAQRQLRGPVRAAIRRRFRARLRKRRESCGAALPLWSRAATNCWCVRGRKRVCSAVCLRCHAAIGLPGKATERP